MIIIFFLNLFPILKLQLDRREPDDPCPYLLAIWTPGMRQALKMKYIYMSTLQDLFFYQLKDCSVSAN